MRKAKHFLLMAAMLLGSVGASAETVEIDGIWYNLISKVKQAEVTSSGGTDYSGSITIPSSVTYEGVEYSVTSIGSWAFAFYDFYGCSSLTSIILPGNSQLTSIGDYAFYGCSSLTSITIPGNSQLTNIGVQAFSGCSSLTSITIPEGVTSIGSSAFSDCSSLTSIVVAEGNKVYDSRGGCNAIIETSSNTLIQGCSTTIIPESVTSIGEGAFFYCSSLTSITLPEGVTSIGDRAFSACRSLTSITLPEGVTSIEWGTFNGCSSLTSITIPEGVTSIGSWAFSDCPELTDVYCHAEKVPSTKTNAFNGSNIEYATLHVPTCAVNEYKNTAPWSGFGKFETTSIAVASITLSASSATLTEGESLTLTTTVSPDDAEDKSISWSSSAPNVATVDNAGKVTAIALGTAIITATANDGSGVSASCEVTVTPASYIITFLVDGGVYATETLKPGATITVPDAPTKEGHTFSGWSGLPETMPAKDITVSATFTVNKYQVTFKIDGVVIATYTQDYGSAIVAPEAPEREGYTFSGWGDVPETVPAADVTYEGSYTANLYNVYYFVGATLVHSVKVAYGEAIPEYIYEPEEEGYIFLGWIGETYATMPAHDVTYTANIDNGIGTLTIDCSQLNIYDLTGRKVTDTENLKGGIYIINGKKVVIND